MKTATAAGLLTVLALISTGCTSAPQEVSVEGFSLQDVEPVDENRTDILRQAASKVVNRSYSSVTEARLQISTGLFGLNSLSTSRGRHIYNQGTRISRITQNGTVTISLAGRNKTTNISRTLIYRQDKVLTRTEGPNASSNWSVRPRSSNAFGPSSLISLFGMENTTTLGTSNIRGKRAYVFSLKLDPGESASIFEGLREKYSFSSQSETEPGKQEIESVEFNESRALLWVSKQKSIPLRFGYYGSVSGNATAIGFKITKDYSEWGQISDIDISR